MILRPKTLLPALATLLLIGCGENTARTLGFIRDAPDEFVIIRAGGRFNASFAEDAEDVTVDQISARRGLRERSPAAAGDEAHRL